MMEKQSKKKHRTFKMNAVELLQNKDRLKEIAEIDPNLKRTDMQLEA